MESVEFVPPGGVLGGKSLITMGMWSNVEEINEGSYVSSVVENRDFRENLSKRRRSARRWMRNFRWMLSWWVARRDSRNSRVSELDSVSYCACMDNRCEVA
jgi:hypothetical protein